MKNIDIAFAKRIVDGINHHITGFSPVTYESLKKLSKPNHVIMLNSSFSYSDSLDSYYKLLDWAKRKFNVDSEQLYNLFLEKITKAIGKVRVSTCGDEIMVSFGHKSESLSSIRLETIDAIGCKYNQIATFDLVNKDLGVSISYRNISNITDIEWPKDKLMYNNILPEDCIKPLWVGLIVFKDGSMLMRVPKLIDGERKEIWSRLTPVDGTSYQW